MLVFFASLILIVYGGIKLDWDMAETAAVFLALAVIEGVLGGFGPSAISKEFLEAARRCWALPLSSAWHRLSAAS